MTEGKKYLYIGHNKTISYNGTGWYINDKLQNKENDELRDNCEIACDYVKRETQTLITQLSAHFNNLVILTAAGTSLDNGPHSGKSRNGLWKECKSELKAVIKGIIEKNGCNQKLKEIIKSQNIEDFLSYALLFQKLNGAISEDAIGKLEKKIANACNLDLDENNTHHGEFLNRVTAKNPNDPRVQLFTTNYDTLFEQAAQKCGFVVIDGFSFTFPRIFSGRYFDYDLVHREKTRLKQEESFIPKVIHLYKLHGSINWEKLSNGQIEQKEHTDLPCIVYPASEKYESSYEQPYFEMMSRLQQALRKENTLMIVIGFGFQDKHIENVIKEAVNQNASFHLIVVNYNRNEKEETGILHENLPHYVDEKMNVAPNVTVIFSTFKEFVDLYPVNNSYYTKINQVYSNDTL